MCGHVCTVNTDHLCLEAVLYQNGNFLPYVEVTLKLAVSRNFKEDISGGCRLVPIFRYL